MVLILTPLKIEFDALKAGLNRDDVMVAVAGHGKVQFALNCQKMIWEIKPSLVIGCGAAGSLDTTLNGGDVVVASSIIEHDFNLKFVKRDLPRFECDAKAVKMLSQAEAGNFQLRSGVIASGDEDIVDDARARELQSLTGACAVTWESAGLARACSLSSKPFVELRAITDSADKNAITDFQKYVKIGMANIAQVLNRSGILN